MQKSMVRIFVLLFSHAELVSCPDPTLCKGKGVWWIWTQSLGQGKEFECSNVIAASAQSYGSPTAGMHCAITCNIYKFESSARTHAALLTNQVQSLFQYCSGGACPLSLPNQDNSPNSPDPFSLRGLGTRLMQNTHAKYMKISTVRKYPTIYYGMIQSKVEI